LYVDIYKINILNGEVQKRLNLQRGSFTAIEYGLGSLWLADYQSNKILRIDPETGEIISSFPNPGILVDGLTFAGGSFWISDSSNLTIYELTTEGSVLRTFLSPGQSPRGLTFDGHDLWNVDGSGKIYQLSFRE
jgi:DNA-binding beta-propeller fold protein YncE